MKNLKYYVLVIAVAVLALIGIQRVSANPLYLPATVQTATATTTVNFLTGILNGSSGTTTLVYDSYLNGTPTKPNGATLLVQYAGSSTVSVLQMNVEYSNGFSTTGGSGLNCVTSPTACDWYQDNINSVATSTGLNLAQTPNSISWTFASSTAGQQGLTAGEGTSSKAFNIQTPLRYVRVIFTAKGVANGSGAIWAQIAPYKEGGNVQ